VSLKLIPIKLIIVIVTINTHNTHKQTHTHARTRVCVCQRNYSMLVWTLKRVQNFNLYRIFNVINMGNNNEDCFRFLRVIDYYSNFVERNVSSYAEN